MRARRVIERIHKRVSHNRFRITLGEFVEMDLQFEKSNLADRNTLEVLDQVFLDLELGFLFCSGPPSPATHGDVLLGDKPAESHGIIRFRNE